MRGPVSASEAGVSLREECGAPQPAQPGIGQARTRGASDEPPDEPAERTGSGARPLQYRQGRCAVVAPAVEDKDHSGTAGVGPIIDILIIAVVGGLRHPIGPFIGALIYVVLRTFARSGRMQWLIPVTQRGHAESGS